MKCNIVGTEKIQSVVIRHKGCGLMARTIKRFDWYPVDRGWSGEPIMRSYQIPPETISGILEIEVEDFDEVCDLVMMFEKFLHTGREKIGHFEESEEE